MLDVRLVGMIFGSEKKAPARWQMPPHGGTPGRTMMRAITLLVAGLVAQTATPMRLPPIQQHGVGAVILGADAEKIYEAFAGRRELVDLGYEGMLSPALLLRFAGLTQRDGVVAELVASQQGLIVGRIEIRDPAFRTLKGIGVGSTVSALRSAYRLNSVGSGEGNVFIRVEELSASFKLDTGRGGSELWRVRDPALVPDSVRIASVLLTR